MCALDRAAMWSFPRYRRSSSSFLLPSDGCEGARSAYPSSCRTRRRKGRGTRGPRTSDSVSNITLLRYFPGLDRQVVYLEIEPTVESEPGNRASYHTYLGAWAEFAVVEWASSPSSREQRQETMRERRRIGYGANAFALTLTLALWGCDSSAGDGQVAAGLPAPSFAAPTMAGDTVTLADLRGEHVLLNVWATWCLPCREEMPDLQAIHESYAERGLRVVGVSIDQAHGRRDIERFVDERGIDFTILHDAQGSVTRLFRTVGVPETFLIEPDGTLGQRWFGQIDPVAVRERLDATLDEG
ncbi:MAG: redoxin domain-containing protein [Gemmatimonas sp.]|nr:redoxin domain-containing protein [Gemmatimonas sp.]